MDTVFVQWVINQSCWTPLPELIIQQFTTVYLHSKVGVNRSPSSETDTWNSDSTTRSLDLRLINDPLTLFHCGSGDLVPSEEQWKWNSISGTQTNWETMKKWNTSIAICSATICDVLNNSPAQCPCHCLLGIRGKDEAPPALLRPLLAYETLQTNK